MFTEFISQNLIIREWLNGSLFPLTANLAFIIGVYIWQTRQYGLARAVNWRSLPGVQTACALFWVFGAESVRAGFVWIILRTTNDGYRMNAAFEAFANFALVVGASLLVFWTLRCTYIFTPPSIRRYYWIYSLALTTAFLLLSHLFPTYPALTH